MALQETAKKLGGGFDLIIDDGSHVPEHQVLSARTLIPPILNPDGIYIIEDVWAPEQVVPQLPYRCEIKAFQVERDNYDRLVVIDGWAREGQDL
jgi:hypothetical protein